MSARVDMGDCWRETRTPWAAGPRIPALATLGFLAGAVTLLAVYESIAYAEHRRALHAY